MTEGGTTRETIIEAVIVPPMAAARWWLLGAAWGCFIAALPLVTVERNAFMRWRMETHGAGFHRWVLADLPVWVIKNLLGRELGYIPPMDVMWLAAAITAIGLFIASPLIFVRVRRPATLLVLRYVALALLVLPVTIFLPAELRYPQPRIGMYFLAAAHALVLVGLWCPWPVLRRPDHFFVMTPDGEKSGADPVSVTGRGDEPAERAAYNQRDA